MSNSSSGAAVTRVLGLCSRPVGDDAFWRLLADTASAVEDWDGLVENAQYHGISALVHDHLIRADVGLPGSVDRQLLALRVRQGHRARIYAAALEEVSAEFERRGLLALVLKGGALAHMVYPQPSARPVDDLDLLVQPASIREAMSALRDLGYSGASKTLSPPYQHLAPVTRLEEGVVTMIEVHRWTATVGGREYCELEPRGQEFRLGASTVRTLGAVDMLGHVHHHIAYHLFFLTALRLKWVADLVGWAERYSATLDWRGLDRLYPGARGALATLDQLTPLSEGLRSAANLSIGDGFRGAYTEICGEDGAPSRRPRRMHDVVFPADWRLRFHYGLDASKGTASHRLLFPFTLVRFAVAILRFHGFSWRSLRTRPFLRARRADAEDRAPT